MVVIATKLLVERGDRRHNVDFLFIFLMYLASLPACTLRCISHICHRWFGQFSIAGIFCWWLKENWRGAGILCGAWNGYREAQARVHHTRPVGGYWAVARMSAQHAPRPKAVPGSHSQAVARSTAVPCVYALRRVKWIITTTILNLKLILFHFSIDNQDELFTL